MVPNRSAVNRRLRSEAGFTWSELLLVIVFVTGLLTIAIVSINGIRSDTNVANCRDALRALKVATEQYHSANDSYPVNKDVLVEEGIVKAGDVKGWRLEFAAGATVPTYVPTGDCV